MTEAQTVSSEAYIDIETDGLNPTKIHLLGQLVDGEYTEHFQDFTYEKGVTYYAHNGIGFDYPVLNHLWGCGDSDSGTSLKDTLVLSRLANPSRDNGHSLDAWGSTLGYAKGDHSDWTQLSDEMRTYCKRDVELLSKVHKRLQMELKGFSEESIELEHQVARIVHQQVENGWLLDQGKVWDLLATLKEKKFELEDEVHTTFRPVAKAVREITPKINKDGTTSKVGLKYLGDDCLLLVGGTHTRIEFEDFNLGSRKQIGERLVALGWKPTSFTPTGQPIVSESVLMRLEGFPEAELIADFLTVQKRIAMAQSWLDAVGDDGRVHGRVNSNGAVTGRMTHYEPNMAQVTAGSKIYGKEMRQCWTSREGYKIVGCDASGLELRMLAHYMADDEYTKEVLDGDVHTANQRAAGLPTRDGAKTFIYAFLYGAGDAKIGSIVGGTKGDGRKLKAKFLANTPALRTLRGRVEQAAKRGWLKGLDGRRIYVRSSHAALNTLLQGAGAVIMKQALVYLDEAAKEHGLDYKFVGNIHDEFQTEVLEAHTDFFGELAVQAIEKAGEHFNLRCPTTGEYKVGNNWSETH